MKKKLSSKITASHTTYLEHCVPFVKYAEKSNLVDKISLGIITITPKAKGGSRRVKCTQNKACLLVTVRANRGLQKLYFFCKTTEDLICLESEIQHIANENHFAIQS